MSWPSAYHTLSERLPPPAPAGNTAQTSASPLMYQVRGLVTVLPTLHTGTKATGRRRSKQRPKLPSPRDTQVGGLPSPQQRVQWQGAVDFGSFCGWGMGCRERGVTADDAVAE